MGGAALALICRNSVAEYLVISQGIATLPAGITGVTFNGINTAIFNLFYDSNMVGETIGTAGFFFVPVEENNHTWCGFCAVICPLAPLPEPVDTVDAAGKFGDDTGIDVTALIGAPGDKTGAPFHTTSEAIPGPVRLAANIAHLGQSNGYDHIIGSINAVQDHGPERTVFICQ